MLKKKGIFALVSLFILKVTNPKTFSVLVIQIEKHLCLQDRQKCLLKGQCCKLMLLARSTQTILKITEIERRLESKTFSTMIIHKLTFLVDFSSGI